MIMITQKEMAEAYQPLFDFMSREYNVTLLKSDMDEILEVTDKVTENLQELYRCKCDVEGCDLTQCNGGGHYRETGYWCLCQKHSEAARAGKPQPKMKQEAIDRENSRDENGIVTLY